MRYSGFFGKTIKEVPGDIKAASHRYLYQGGFIRQISAGRYVFLPLGQRVWQKIADIIDEEMEAIGSQRITTPILHPIEIWQTTNRDQAFGDLMLLTEDHHGSTFAVGATAEGLMVELVKQFTPSYRDLPIVVHQFVQKFRDELRPRGGLLRVREFMMKDAYSFAATEEASLDIYRQFYDAYLRIADRLGLNVIPVEADSGAIGGDYGHEFTVLVEVGEDTIYVCDNCDYAANAEKAEFVHQTMNIEEEPAEIEKVEAVRGRTMQDGVKLHELPLWQQIKDVLFVDENGRFVLAVIRGDYDVNETKLKNAVGAMRLRPATDEEVRTELSSEPGFISPVGINKLVSEDLDFVVVGDPSVRTVKNAYGGANEKNRDYVNINIDRDYALDVEVDIAEAKSDVLCASCEQGFLAAKRGVEFGHTFKQDLFYTAPHEGNFVDRDGEEKPLWMGAYGIGVGRAMAILVETHHDDNGIVWPENVAPFQAHLVEIAGEDDSVRDYGEKIYHDLTSAGVGVLYDDRVDVSAGEKFADADLIGCPVRLVASRKMLEKDRVEWKRRDGEEAEVIGIDEVLKRLTGSNDEGKS